MGRRKEKRENAREIERGRGEQTVSRERFVSRNGRSDVL